MIEAISFEPRGVEEPALLGKTGKPEAVASRLVLVAGMIDVQYER
jgi:hypothetical protein